MLLQTRIQIVITLDWLNKMTPNLDHWKVLLNGITRFSFFHDLNFPNGEIAVKPEFFGFEIANILVCKLHGASIWLKKPTIVSETKTNVLSDHEKKCIYIFSIQARNMFQFSTLFSKISLAAPIATPYYRSVKTIFLDILQSILILHLF